MRVRKEIPRRESKMSKFQKAKIQRVQLNKTESTRRPMRVLPTSERV